MFNSFSEMRLGQIWGKNSGRAVRLMKEGGWIVAGTVLTMLGQLALVRVLTGYLDPVQYGQLALGLTVATLVSQVVMGGIIAGIGRFFSIATEKGDLWGYLLAARRMLIMATAVVVGLGGIGIIALDVTGMHHWVWLATAAVGFSVASSYNSALNGIQNAARQRAIVALHGGMDAWLKTGLAVGAMLLLGYNCIAVMVGYILSTGIVTLSQYFFLGRLVAKINAPSCQSSNASWTKQMWLFAWPIMMGGLFNWGYYASQRWSLELFSTTDEVGKFYALTQVAYTPIALAGSLFLSFITPIIYARVGEPNNNARFSSSRLLIFKIAGIGMSITLLASVIAFFANEWVFQILVAEKYRSFSQLMPFVVLAAGFLQVSLAVGVSISASNKTYLILKLAIPGNILIICANLFSTKTFGIQGLVAAMAISAFGHLIWMLLIARKIQDEF